MRTQCKQEFYTRNKETTMRLVIMKDFNKVCTHDICSHGIQLCISIVVIIGKCYWVGQLRTSLDGS